MIKVPGMLIVGAGDRNAGKTSFACSLIKKFGSQSKIIGIKVTSVNQLNGECPRGGVGCGVCTSFDEYHSITEETDSRSKKDTCRMLAAGASRVFWLRVLKTHLEQGATALLDTVGDRALLICESNTLRQIVEPDVFVMLTSCRQSRESWKQSAKDVAQRADRLVFFDGKEFDISLDDIAVVDGRWTIKMQATAIVMAGGGSARMGQDKSMLSVEGKPMIEYVCDQLRPHFNQIVISSNDAAKYAFLGLEVIEDKVPGKGPLMGIASALGASANEINFVIACDIPQIDMAFVKLMLQKVEGYDAVVPQNGPSRYEPLFAIYKKSALAKIQRDGAWSSNRIMDALKDCKVNYVEMPDKQLTNLNTMDDYRKFIGNENNVAV